MKITSPKTSEKSQFHQPPQEPSCRAHQLPSKSVKAAKKALLENIFKELLSI